MDKKPRTLIGETLRKKLLDDPITEVLDRVCGSPSSDSSSVPLSEPDPYKCQIPLNKVTQRCRQYCRRAMSERAIQCQENCRKYLLMTDTVTGESYKGFSGMIRYLLGPNDGMIRHYGA